MLTTLSAAVIGNLCSKSRKRHFWRPKIKKFSQGACPRTPLVKNAPGARLSTPPCEKAGYAPACLSHWIINRNETSRAIYRWSKLDQIPWVCPRGPAKSFPIVNNLLSLQGKRENTKTVPCPLGFKSVPRRSTHGEANDTSDARYILRVIDTSFVTRNK